ncbi:helix-turn-helix transcriptional regulator [Lysinibacillus mangiferihumi]|uniref:Helix-turn-helix transcriptional regulator n=1 Tax=Lysinibacillus mangiferihumi TaxID=1130819 RepID=A0A4V5TKD7_9BACI|nr:helix-turn-helix transcriptional regulator [Lysinibacillus mangiferihumi]TKI63193.1 helix-turn-helix transcriptional regulator [Lysinibacillus mangiferihumi]
MKVHERIRRYIESNGLKMKYVADKSSIELKRFYRVINGDSVLSADEYERICSGLNVEQNFFKEVFLDSKNMTA